MAAQLEVLLSASKVGDFKLGCERLCALVQRSPSAPLPERCVTLLTEHLIIKPPRTETAVRTSRVLLDAAEACLHAARDVGGCREG